jgi:hypothetical protein
MKKKRNLFVHCAKKLSQHIEFRKYCLFRDEKRYLYKRKRPIKHNIDIINNKL